MKEEKEKPLKILLISPSSTDDIISRTVKDIPYMDSGAFFAPHALAAVAALTPAGHDIILHDEHMRGPADDLIRTGAFDVIGVSLITNQLRRTLEIAEFIKGTKTGGCFVIGGIGTTNVMRKLKDLADVIFIGEAEETWPRFIGDYQAGRHTGTYQQISKPDMEKTPMPRWDLISGDIPKYGAVSVQTSRGCPHDCSFCDVIYTYGRKVRSKTAAQVLGEIRTLMDMGAKMIMIADDNFTANRPYAKEILRALVELNNAQPMPLSFMTQVDITVARDSELLELLADSNFFELQIGIESFEAESLKHMNKKQNLTLDIGAAIRTIQSYGIAVQSHLIIGSDADTAATFSRTADFVAAASITHHSCHPLMAPPGTKLWYELKRQGRLVETDDRLKDQLDITSNIIPKNMTRVEMMEGMARYWETVTSVGHYLPRALGFINGITRKPRVKEPGFAALWSIRGMMFSVFKYYSTGVSKDDRKAFFTLFRRATRAGNYLVPKVIFLYTRYLMDRIRDTNSIAVAREQAAWERTNPDAVTVLTPEVPLSEQFREHYQDIFRSAYQHVRRSVSSKEELYRVVLDAMIDYSDRFNDELASFDDIQRENIALSCERILSQPRGASSGDPAELPETPPFGFEREMLDALDHVKRYAHDRADG